MNKKVKNKNKHDGTEDLEIKRIAHNSYLSQNLLLAVLLILFGLTLFSSFVYIGKYYAQKEAKNKDAEVIQISNKKNKIIITNNGDINKTYTEDDYNKEEDIIIENIDSIEINSEDYDHINKVKIDVRYNITENTFPNNLIATNDSDLMVRFAYSFDNINWEYTSNAIVINNSNQSPLMGAVYDISGIIANIKVATNYELKTNPYEPVKMYWKSETIIKNSRENIGKNIKANFKISYREI